jgi:hypothetical protein
MHCGYAWRLIYERRHLRAQSAAAFYGRLAHQVIRLAYHGQPMEAAHQRVWAGACGAVLPKLEQLITLDTEYAVAGKPQSKAAQLWRERHPEYDALLRDIGTYQDIALGHLKWGEKASLAGFYRRAVALLDHEPDILLPNPILIEGQAPGSVEDEPVVTAPTGDLLAEGAAEDAGDEERDGGYTLLRGTIGGVAVVGVPDIVALHSDGATIRVRDYKPRRPIARDDFSEDAQIEIYTQLLRENGYIAPDQPVQVGHIYLTDSGPVQIWADAGHHAQVLRRIEAQIAHTAALIEAELIISRKGIASGLMSPCAFCDVAHVCDA